MKRCTKCKKLQPKTEFHKHKRLKDGLSCHCKSCRRVYRLNKNDRWERHLKYKFKITPDHYFNMLRQQGGSCKICLKSAHTFSKKLCVDHCHTSGKIRGLLCDSCNVSIGRMGDNIENFKRAIKYLEAFCESKE